MNESSLQNENTAFRIPASLARSWVLPALTLWLGLSASSQGQLVLNEVLADNKQAVANGKDFPDYVELMNRSAIPASLAGLSLTDDPLNPRRYVFPEVSIPPGGYLLVWCDLNTTSPGLHAGFALSASGEQVQLYAADGFTLLDQLVFGIQAGSFSLGRVPDGSGDWTLTAPTAGGVNQAAVTGAKNQLRINEWMARPSVDDDWLELFNGGNLPVALGGLILTDSVGGTPQNRPIPDLSFIEARGFVQMFASDLDKLDADHLDFKLGSEGETLTLYDTDARTVLDRVTFGAQTTDIAQGRAPDGSDNLLYFPAGAATPGDANFEEITAVVISEVLTHTDPPLEDAIELWNMSTDPVDISHWWLSDSVANPQKYRIPPGTVIPASGYAVFYQHQFSNGETGFSLDSVEGDQVFLSAGDVSGRLLGQQTFVEFGALINGVSAGRYQTSVGVDFVPLSERTFGVDNPSSLADFRRGIGKANALPQIGPVVISEIYPGVPGVAGASDQQYIELHNPTSKPAPLFDPITPTSTWRLRDGISFDFPMDRTIPPGGYLLVTSFDPVQEPSALAEFRSRFGGLETTPILGPFDGRISSSGESIKLLQPDKPEGPDESKPGFVPYQLVDWIDYSASAPWPVVDSALDHSWQRREPLSYGNDPVNWFRATPAPGGAAAPSDSDGDGMPDAWEVAHGLSPDSPDDATEDPDTDHAANLAEFLAGTDPRDPLSVFGIDSFQKEGEQVRIVFKAVQGKPYELEAAGQLGGRWQSVTNMAAAPVSGQVNFVSPVHPSSTAVYRLSIPSTP